MEYNLKHESLLRVLNPKMKYENRLNSLLNEPCLRSGSASRIHHLIGVLGGVRCEIISKFSDDQQSLDSDIHHLDLI